MSRRNVTYLIFLILGFILYLGSLEQRLTKAAFLSKTLFRPLINSINRIDENFNLKSQLKESKQELAKQTIKINGLTNALDKIENANIEYNVEDYDFVLGDIVGYSGLYQEKNLILNKGMLDGVHKNYPVISNQGIVGKIQTVSLNYSIVLPYNHSHFKMGVMSKTNNLQGVLQSDIYGSTEMTMINLGSEISIGDTIVTSYISSIFPKGFPVGVVKGIKESTNKIHMQAAIMGFVDPSSLDQVVILKYQKDKSYERELRY